MDTNTTILTTSNGDPVDDNQNSITAGEYGPILLQDFHLIDKLAHFDRERIPERVVHAKGAGAHGYFEVTHDITRYKVHIDLQKRFSFSNFFFFLQIFCQKCQITIFLHFCYYFASSFWNNLI